MEALPTPTKTAMARLWLDSGASKADCIKRVLLSNIDGHRNVIELESFARAMGLGDNAIERLRLEGLIDLSS